MFRRIGIFFIIASTSFLYRCSFVESPASKTLDIAESLIDQNPDSVLTLLEVQIQPQDLSKDLYNKYILLYTQAKDKADKDIANDTLVLNTKTYFKEQGDKKRAAIAAFYSGRVFEARDDKKNAMLSYLDAQKYIKNEDDDALKGLIEYYIGDINYDQLLKDDAILRYRTAASFFNKSDKYKNEIIAYNKMGVSFLMKKEIDSCFYYYNKGLSLAKEHKDSLEIAYLLCNMGVAYSKVDNVDQANNCFRESLQYTTKDDDKAKMYLNIAYYFKTRQNTDSCKYYANETLNLLSNKEDPSTKSVAYGLLSDIEETEGNYKNALAYDKQYASEVKKKMEDINAQSILEVQKKYDFELMKNENNLLFIEKQSALLIILVLVLFILTMSFILYRKHIKNKEALADAEEKICHLKEVIDNYDEKEDSFKKILFQHFDVFKKIALLENQLMVEDKRNGYRLLKKVNDIVYTQDSLDWNMLYETINKLYNGFPDLLRSSYPQLEETEVRIYSLTYAGLVNSEIALILGLTVNTIQMKKSAIRKKLGIGGYGNMVDFINKNIYLKN